MLFFDAYPHVVGGAQRTTLLLAAGLAERGWGVTVATPGVDGPYPAALAGNGIQHMSLPLPSALGHYGRTTRGRRAAVAAAALPACWLGWSRLVSGSFDIVHAVDHRGVILIGPAARLAGLPTVWHVHSVEASCTVNRICAAIADVTVVPSRSVADVAPCGRFESAVEVGNALPERVLSQPPVPGGPGPGRPLRLVCVGRMHPEKGYDVLVDAVGLLRRNGCEVGCRIVCGPGGDLYRQEIEARIAARGLSHAVELVGPVDDVHPFLAEADLYVQPSRSELQPLAVLEAMAAGRGVVATDVGALRTLLEGGRLGVLVAAGDPAALAQGISDAAGDPAATARRAAEARHQVLDRFRPERLVDGIEEVYRSL